MIEESGTPGAGGEGRGRIGESDFLAERRARRATESGEAALLRRAEAAEATVQTLESHVASLQQRLQDAEQERPPRRGAARGRADARRRARERAAPRQAAASTPSSSCASRPRTGFRGSSGRAASAPRRSRSG